MLRWLGAITALAALFFLLLDYPAGFTSLYLILALYSAACLITPYFWLLALPALLLTYDLTPWSGRAGLNEFDMLLLVTLSLGWLRVPKSKPGIGPVVCNRNVLAVWVVYLTGLLVVALQQGLPQLGSMHTLVYYAPDITLLQTRGMLYGLLLSTLWFPLYGHDPRRCQRWTLIGACLGASALALVILWERGVFNDLLSSGAYYQRLRSLLDFSSTYRVTGSFSEMHTGGETIDGVLMWVVPFSLASMLYFRGPWQWLAMLAFLGSSYGVASSFTRTTYAAYGVCLLFFFGVLLARRRSTLAQLHAYDWLTLAANLAVLGLLGTVFRLSGYIGVLASGLMLALGLVASAYPRYGRRLWLLLPAYGLLALLGVYGQLTSKWADQGLVPTLTLAAIFCLIALFGVFFVRRFSCPPGPLLWVGVTLLMLSALMGSVLGGHRMSERVTTVTTDLEKRVDHWSRVLEAMNAGPATIWFGMGKGQFPYAYALAHPNSAKSAGGVRVFSDPEQGDYLRLVTGSDLKLAQRVKVIPDTRYQIRIRLRATEDSSLTLGFCERNILYASDMNVMCSARWVKVRSTNGDWVEHEVRIQSKRVGRKPPWKRWPTVFYLKNAGAVAVDIEHVWVQANGQPANSIRNGGFRQGLDYWFYYNDFKHLQWHIKNLYLAIYFELGVLGVILVGGVVGMAVYRGARKALSGEPLALAAWLSVVSVLVVGVMGNPLDSARASLLFYWLINILLFTRFQRHSLCEPTPSFADSGGG